MRRRPGGRTRRLWQAIRRRIPGLRGGGLAPEPDRPDEEPALVPVGPPRRRPPAAAVALEPPAEIDPLEYPTETDAVGREDDDEDFRTGQAL
jgi:hypothetical protein